MTLRHRHLAPLTRVALLVAIGDYVTKDAAVRWQDLEPAALSDWLRFAVVHNERAAFGFSLGAYTWHLNLAITLAAILFVMAVSRDLTGVDKRAPIALGLIVGGATGNLASLILSPRGVVDFIAIDFSATAGIILNIADVAAYVGLAMIMRTGFLIVAAMRRELHENRRAIIPTPVLDSAVAEREVSRPVFREPGRAFDVEAPAINPRPDTVRADDVKRDITRPLSIDALPSVPARVIEFPLSRARNPLHDRTINPSPRRWELH